LHKAFELIDGFQGVKSKIWEHGVLIGNVWRSLGLIALKMSQYRDQSHLGVVQIDGRIDGDKPCDLGSAFSQGFSKVERKMS